MKENMQPVAIYHRVMRRENFETAAKDLIGLLEYTGAVKPPVRRIGNHLSGHKETTVPDR